MVHTDSQINCVHIGTTDRPNVWLIRRTTIPISSIDLNRFNQIDVSRRVSLGKQIYLDHMDEFISEDHIDPIDP